MGVLVADEIQKEASGSDLDKQIQNWKAAAIGGAWVAAIVTCAVAIWVFTGELPTDAVGRSRAFIPFGAMIVAAVTLATIVWRAALSERQTQLQQEQIAAAERVHLADLLQKGVELLSSEEDAKQMAGIVSLEQVATGAHFEMALYAMNILADYLGENFPETQEDKRCSAVIAALRAGHRKSEQNSIRIADRRLSFVKKEHSFLETPWAPLIGVSGVNYTGGGMSAQTIANLQSRYPYRPQYHFKDTLISGLGRVEIEIDFYAYECIFFSCAFTGVHPRYQNFLENNTFEECDFSGFEFKNCELPDLIEGENYYFQDDPPTANREVNWRDYLICSER